MIRSLKSLAIIMILAFAGMGIYYAGKNALSFFDPGQNTSAVKVAKKIAPAKLANIQETGPEHIVKEKKQPYTFYEILNDENMEKFVGLDGKVHIPVAPVEETVRKEAPKVVEKEPKVVSDSLQALDALNDLINSDTLEQKEESSSVKVVLTSGVTPELNRSLRLLQPIRTSTVKPVRLASVQKGEYSLQVSSLRDGNKAQQLAERLQKKGYSAYVKAAIVPSAGSWNRVYIGPFSQIEQARKARTHYSKVEGSTPLLVKLP